MKNEIKRFAEVTSMEFNQNAGRKAHLSAIRGNDSVHENNLSADCKDKTEKEAEKIVDDAKREADKIRKQSKNEERTSEDCFGSDVKMQAVQKYLAEERALLKRDLERKITSLLMTRDGQIGEMEKFHDSMVEKTGSLHAIWTRELTKTIDELSRMKKELYEYIHQWQISLYPYEIEPLAQRFVELYKFINVDRIVEQEILFECSCSEDETVGAENDFCASRAGIVSPKTIDNLQKLNRTLTIFLRKFEMSLNGLGLYAYYPKEGEAFDEIWHTPERDDYDNTGDMIIKRCVVPGVAKKVNDEGEDDVIIPAIVKIDGGDNVGC